MADQNYMTANEYYAVIEKLKMIYTQFFPGIHCSMKDRAKEYHDKLDQLLALADLHSQFSGELTRKGIRSFEEGSWCIDSGFRLDTEWMSVWNKLKEVLEEYKRRWG